MSCGSPPPPTCELVIAATELFQRDACRERRQGALPHRSGPCEKAFGEKQTHTHSPENMFSLQLKTRSLSQLAKEGRGPVNVGGEPYLY